MEKLAVLSTVALIGIGSLATAPDAEARPWHRHRGGGAVAAGVIGGLAAGALIGAAASSAYAAPAYYDYGYAPAYGYGYAPVSYGYARPVYRTRVVRRYAPVTYHYAPAYRTRVVRTYYAPASYSYGYSWGGPSYYYGW